MMKNEYKHVINEVLRKAEYLKKCFPGAETNVIQNSVSLTYLNPEYDSGITIENHIKNESNVLILASWFSLGILEIFNNSNKVKNVTLLDHDKTVIKVGEKISPLYSNINVRYIRKNVIFDDINEYIDNQDIIIIPSLNMLLPIDEFLPNLSKNTIVSLTGSNNMKMKYGNIIYNVDDLKSQVKYSELLFSKKYESIWNGNYKFTTSLVVAKI